MPHFSFIAFIISFFLLLRARIMTVSLSSCIDIPQKERMEARFPAMGEGRPMPPMGGGRPPMGGSRPSMPEGGFPPMMGQGFPPMPQENPEERAERMKKQVQKREKKMKKILTEEQFARWKELQARPPHPVPPEAERPAD